MNTLKRSVTLCLFLLVSFSSFSQQLSNLCSKKFTPVGDTIRVDTFSIIPQTLFIRDLNSQKLIANTDYDLDLAKAVIIWKNKPVTDSIRITYRVFFFNLAKVDFNKDSRLIEPDVQFNYNPFDYTPPQNAVESIFNYNGLNYQGSLVRGISFGNSQDVTLNSSFNLQMAGEIGNGVEVLAALTDNNIPVQPDGNTQQLQEFDKVFIQVSKDESKLIMGDFEINRPNSYFMNFYKKLQGGQYSTAVKLPGGGLWKTSNSAAVSKGKFARNTFDGVEGNQGPYKLKGADGETFIIVLAGSERVFIDGKLMTRGTDHDYTIDYNLGEITFTPSRLITKDSRVAIEFEYSDKSFFRSLVFLNNEITSGKWNFRINAYSEQDSKNQPVQNALTDQEKLKLESVGDSVQNAFLPGIQNIAFDPQRILYKVIDSTVNLVTYDSVFVYSTDSTKAHYSLTFAQVLPGKGDYVIAQTSANGRVYKWVAPVGGVHQGNYAPIQVLVTPKKQQMITVAADYHFAKNALFTTEFAASNKDDNTFGLTDKADDDGYAVKSALQKKFLLSKTKQDFSLSTNFDYEYAGKTFRPIERYRPVEFDRDWNLLNTSKNEEEQLANAEIIWANSNLLRLQYRASGYLRGNNYKGLQHAASTHFNKKGFDLTASGSLLQSQDSLVKTSFLRPKADFSKTFTSLQGIKIGVFGEEENDRIQSGKADTLESQSFRYDDLGVYLKTADSTDRQFSISYDRRTDYKPNQTVFGIKTIADTWTAGGKLNHNANNQLGWQLSVRNLLIKNELKADSTVKNYLGRIDYSFSVLKGFFRSSILYQIGTGQEQKREYSYQKVTEGQGIYQWKDYNKNGIQESNEFEVAAFQDSALYIRVVIPTDQYIPVDITQFNYLLAISPESKWDNKKGALKMLSRFSTQSTLQINRKQFNNGVADYFNPFDLNVVDTSLISIDALILNTLYFNRTNSVFGIELSRQNNTNKVQLVNGFESKKLVDYKSKIRWNITRSVNTNVSGDYSLKSNASENFPEKNYQITSYEASPSITCLFSSTFRGTVDYTYSQRTNADSLGTQALSHQVVTSFKYNIVNKSTLEISGTFAAVNFSGTSNSPLEFAMLDGLKNGNNFLWNLTYNRKLSEHVELSLSYDGRKTGTSRMVHTGRAQVTALF